MNSIYFNQVSTNQFFVLERKYCYLGNLKLLIKLLIMKIMFWILNVIYTYYTSTAH